VSPLVCIDDCPIIKMLPKGIIFHCYSLVTIHSRVSFCDGSFYDDTLLRPLSSQTEHSRLVVRHCHNSSVLSLLSALLALFRCACVSAFSVLVQLFLVYCDFSTRHVHQKTEKKNKSKQLTLHSFLISSETRPGPSSTK